MRRPTFCLVFLLLSLASLAGRITGTVKDNNGVPLAYASITVKGTGKGTHANGFGQYSINLAAGQYVLICEYVNYQKQERSVTITSDELVVNFSLQVHQLTLSEVVVKKGEDPAYEIIRQAIKKRDYYNNQVDSFSVNVYIKGLLRSRGMPARVFGKKVEREDNDGLDSAGKGILFLSESVTKVSYSRPNKIKFEVLSSRQSGGGFGLSFPFFINFYQNNVSVFDNNLNPRGFISPIADGAINYYKFRYEGSFIEDDKLVNTIRVTPRRKNEPLFSGTIQITEDDWRIYSLQLETTNDYSLELIDTLRISQIHKTIGPDTWKTQNQLVYVAVKKLGFDFAGNFVNIYSDYDLSPGFDRKHFNRTVMKYDSAFNRKDSVYWNTVRPVALEPDEKRNFVFKDSVARLQRDSFMSRRHIDSLRKNQKPITLKGLIWSGAQHNFYSKRGTILYSIKPLIPQVEYNTVEGVSINIEQEISGYSRLLKRQVSLQWNSRYGISNSHFNSYGFVTLRKPMRFSANRYIKLGGGKRVSQFNHDNPIDPLSNAVYTLLARRNYMKLYENYFGNIELSRGFENGFRFNVQANFEHRLPLDNRADYSLKKGGESFSPNHPYELADIPFLKHQALVTSVKIGYQPGQHYIEFPWGKSSIGSKAPIFELEYAKGIRNLFGSDVDFDKWKFSVSDDMNFRIAGEFKYKVSIGGFFNNRRVEIPDLQHFNGNQTFYNIKYLNSFQLAPYYRYSNAERFYALFHAEHHFNGLITNKIPLFNKLKWNLVVGANSFYVNRDNYYVEVFAGIENIFKMFRIDFVNAYQPGLGNKFGVRIGFGGLLGGKVKFQ